MANVNYKFAIFGEFGDLNKMDKQNLYNPANVVVQIKAVAKSKKIPIKDLLSSAELGTNTLSHMNHGKAIAFDSLARIADYLGCSVDYLLGRTDNPEVNR